MDSGVKLEDGNLVTDSMTIAKHFGKRHDHVILAIRNLGCSPEFARLNFVEWLKINRLANGKPVPFYEITRDGFAMLCMGFTGAKAMEWKEKFLAEFATALKPLLEIRSPCIS